MRRLIINTAINELFLVLQDKDKVFSLTLDSSQHHNETMLSKIDQLLASHGLKIKDIEEFGVVIGPGSFTGIRVGIATIKAFRDVTGVRAVGINNLDYLFMLAQSQNSDITTVAIKSGRDNFYVATLVNGVRYKYERTLSIDELKEMTKDMRIGMFEQCDEINAFVVQQSAEILLQTALESKDESLKPVYYQLSQAEKDKLRQKPIQISTASIEDLEEIYRLEQKNIRTNQLSKNDIERALKDENYTTLIAKIEDTAIGFIILLTTDESNILSIAVNKKYRNIGVASRLIDSAVKYLKSKNVDTLSLEVDEKNITAYLLYQKLGFTTRRRRKAYYANGNDCLEMSKKI